MAISTIDTVQFDLSMISEITGNPLTANMYTVDGVYDTDGVTRRKLSIGQLVMAVCLKIATDYEKQIIDKMAANSRTTTTLEALTDIQSQFVVNGEFNATPSSEDFPDGKWHYYVNGESVERTTSSWSTLLTDLGIQYASGELDSAVSEIGNKMDSLNSVNQQDMIELQSLTNKRDQAYDLISAVLKSLNTVLLTNVNNY